MTPGTVLAGRYEIERPIGRGGMSTVFRARDLRLFQPVAVKRLDLSACDPAEQAGMAAHLAREGRLLARLSHPALVVVRDCFEEDGRPHLVTDFIEGRDLQTVMDTEPGGLEPHRLWAWVQQVLDALEYLHSRQPPVLFRDLKPANLMVDRSGQVKLVDFGIARAMLPGRGTTALLRGFGTPGYAPIEQYGAGTDTRSDLYSLGATLYALATRQTPPDAVRLASGEQCLTRVSSPPGLGRVIERLMQTRKEARYPCVAEVRAALRAVYEPAPATRRQVAYCPFRDAQPLPGVPSPAPDPWT
ncbi:MAG: serine/threonine-protein kinase, partial [Candidatus Eremiobacterota bacterium]